MKIEIDYWVLDFIFFFGIFVGAGLSAIIEFVLFKILNQKAENAL